MKTQEIRYKVRLLMILRVTVITLLLGSLAVLQFHQNRQLTPAVYFIIATTYFLTIVYALVYNSIKDVLVFAYVQILGDVLLATAVVYSTGGLDSPFSFTYLFSIIAAGLILPRMGSIVFASLSGVAYGLVVGMQYYGAILSAPARTYSISELVYNIFLTIVPFYPVGFLVSILSARLKLTKEELEEKSIDLQALQALNESIVRSMADGMMTVGLDGRITGFNKAAEEITGRRASEVIGMSFSELFNWLGIETFFDDIEAARKLPYRYDLKFEGPGKELILGITLSSLRNEKGDIKGLLGIFQDLTPMKEMEEEIKKKDRLAAIGELSAGMAHEIRNPLASLSGSLQVLKEDLQLSEDNTHLMEIALNEMDRLNNIVTQFLTYARPSAPLKELCDIASIVRDMADLITNSREFRDGVEFKTELPETPLVIWADPGQMRQILYNLALNALQSLQDAGTIRIKVFARGADIVIDVVDDGEGIQEEDINKIFYPFFSTKTGGSGLGLAIVYRIVEDHGGEIKVHSVPAGGTRFTISMPLGVS
jgi:two-component system sensor histidine kinase PilS (NtrC family)